MLRLSPFITVYCCAVAALLGACTGSFLACLAWRTVHGESVLRGRSHCDVCGHVLGVRDLVPVFSYLLSGGKCRYCGAKLSARHVWGELISAAVFVSLLLQYDISLQTLEAWLLACVLLACTFADLEGYIIPDRFVAAGVVLFIATLFWEPEPLRRALDGALGGVTVAGGPAAAVPLYGQADAAGDAGRRRYQAAVSHRALFRLEREPAVPGPGLRGGDRVGPCRKTAGARRFRGDPPSPSARGSPLWRDSRLSTGIWAFLPESFYRESEDMTWGRS